jgi:hypothetical protein
MSEASPKSAGISEALPVTAAEGVSWRSAAILLTGALVLVAALVGSAPFWAPLLPWSPAADRGDASQLGERIDRLAAAQDDAQHRLDQTAAAADAAAQRLDRRMAALEAKPAGAPADLTDLRQQIAKLSESVNDLGGRLDALDKTVHARAALDPTDVALALAVLPIRDAVAAGRPFAAQYKTLTVLARNRPDIAQAALPLSEPAKTGVATVAALEHGLRLLGADTAVTAAAPAAPRGWTEAMVARLAGLIAIRRVDDGAAPERLPQTLDQAQQALARGDLGGAVTALDTLSGAPAAAAAPWLARARQKLAADAAVQRLETATTARLGNAQ